MNGPEFGAIIRPPCTRPRSIGGGRHQLPGGISMKRNVLMLAVCLIVAIAGCGDKAPVENPFFTEWTTPFGVPPFDQIHEEHFLPAFERAIAEQRAEVEAIAQNPEPPTFENTLVALDATGMLMSKVSGFSIPWPVLKPTIRSGRLPKRSLPCAPTSATTC